MYATHVESILGERKEKEKKKKKEKGRERRKNERLWQTIKLRMEARTEVAAGRLPREKWK